MTSNSKLAPAQKARRKSLRAAFLTDGGTLHSFPQYGVTIAIIPCNKQGDRLSKTATMYTSIASNEETKFRRKVGEFHVLARWEFGQGAIIPNPEVFGPSYNKAFAEEMAATFNIMTNFSDSHNDDGTLDHSNRFSECDGY